MARAQHHSRGMIAALLAAGILAACSPAQQTPPQASPASAPEPVQESGGDVTVLAGSMIPGFADGDAVQAQFIKPYGICAAPDGGLILADSYAHKLREIRGGEVTTLAGLSSPPADGQFPLGGYRNGEAAQALLNRPRFADVSREGAVVFSDSENNMLRVLQNGSVFPLAGVPESGFADGDVKSARFHLPSGVAIGANGDVYVADTLNHAIRVVSPDGQVRTLTGGPEPGLRDGSLDEARFCEPNDIALAPDGALYVVDKGNQRIRRIHEGTVATVAGSGDTADPTTGYILGGYADGPAQKAQFLYPSGICISEGIVYIADTGNNCIRALTPGGEVSTVAGSRTAGNRTGTLDEARFNQPLDVLCQNSILYVTDSYNHVVKSVALDSGTNTGKGGAS